MSAEIVACLREILGSKGRQDFLGSGVEAESQNERL